MHKRINITNNIRRDNMTNLCSDIIQQWIFSKDAIDKMNQIIDKTKIIERGGVLCGNEENKKINLISECKGDRCSIEVDSWKECAKQNLVPMGNFHTHPGNIVKIQPSIGDLGFLYVHGTLMCIGAPKTKDDRIICIKQKNLNKEDELDRNKEIDYTYRLETKIKNLPFIATKKEREEYDKRFKDIFPGKYYYKFDPSKCME
jgi:hypothetical protein